VPAANRANDSAARQTLCKWLRDARQGRLCEQSVEKSRCSRFLSLVSPGA